MKRENILSTISAENFIGRTAELDFILRHAKEETDVRGLLVLSAPALGASELLRQIYDQLFYEQSGKIPFYFRLKKSDKTAENAALRFLQNFLLQTVAFRRNDKKILDASPEICEISQLAQPSDGYWIDRLIETCQSDSKLNNKTAFIKNCLSAPLRAAANDFDALFNEIADSFFAHRRNFSKQHKRHHSRRRREYTFYRRFRLHLAKRRADGQSEKPF